jgi:DNA-binding XRE family transcriptional regulator
VAGVTFRWSDVPLRQVSLVQLSEIGIVGQVLDPLSTFAANLRRLREERGLSQEQLGEAANVHTTHVSKIERGRCEPGVRTVCKLARALRVSAGALFESVNGDELDAD